MIDAIKSHLNESMTKNIHNLKNQLLKVRTGRASAHILDGVMVNYYGTATPINQVGQISTPEARLLQIRPFEKTLLPEIEKAILAANLGVTPSNDGNIVRIPFPSLTEEKRKDLVKTVKKLGEDTKIILRNVRREENDKVKKAEKDKTISEDDLKKYQDEIQVLTDKYIEEVDHIISAKEKELLTI